MKKYFLAAIVATAPLLASTSAHAITVDEGSQLSITVIGSYAVRDGGDLNLGSVLDLSNVQTFNISQVNPGGIDLDGLSSFSPVSVSGPFTLGDGLSNEGVELGFATNDPDTFTLGESFGAESTTDGTGASSLFGVGGFSNGDAEDGSFSWATTSVNPTGTFQLTIGVPPEVEIPTPTPTPIPLPAAAWMMLAGLGSLWAFRRRNV